MSKHTKAPWVIKKDMIYGNNGRESIACVLDGAWPHGLRPDHKANAHRIVSCVNALEGLSDDALDGDWNFKDLSNYIKSIESQRDELLKALEEIVNVAERIDTAEFFPSAPLERALDAIAKAKGE